MNDPFEIWAPREIRRLREEADALQLSLDRYAAANGRKPRQMANAPTPNPIAGEGHSQGRRSKYESLFVKWGEASREKPLTYSDMQEIAVSTGTQMDKGLLRSTVHAQKQLGRVHAEGEGYVWRYEEQKETAPSVQEDAVS